MTAARNIRYSATVDDANEVLRTEQPGTQLHSFANTVRANATVIKMLNEQLDAVERELRETKRTLRVLSDSFDDQSELVERLKKELGHER